MSTPANRPRRDYSDLADLLEDLGLAVMLFSGAAIVAMIVLLMVIL